jgi:hypothetical protein
VCTWDDIPQLSTHARRCGYGAGNMPERGPALDSSMLNELRPSHLVAQLARGGCICMQVCAACADLCCVCLRSVACMGGGIPVFVPHAAHIVAAALPCSLVKRIAVVSLGVWTVLPASLLTTNV